MIQRPADDGPCVIDAPHSRQSVLVDGLAFLVKEGHPDMPFAEEGGGVALLPEHGRQGEAFLLDEAGTTDPGEDAAVIQPEGQRYIQ